MRAARRSFTKPNMIPCQLGMSHARGSLENGGNCACRQGGSSRRAPGWRRHLGMDTRFCVERGRREKGHAVCPITNMLLTAVVEWGLECGISRLIIETSRRLRWDVCFDQNAARNIQNTNSGLLERDVQCNVLIHDRSPGNKPQRQTWWHASRAESGRADYPMCENASMDAFSQG
jgi:hypothetical protein